MFAVSTHAKAPYKSEGEGISDILLFVKFSRFISVFLCTKHFEDIT
jgi:hypothetical protein